MRVCWPCQILNLSEGLGDEQTGDRSWWCLHEQIYSAMLSKFDSEVGCWSASTSIERELSEESILRSTGASNRISIIPRLWYLFAGSPLLLLCLQTHRW